MKKEYNKVLVDWDTDGEEYSEKDLPTLVNVPTYVEEEDIADWLSDEYGFCVNWFQIKN